MPTFTAESGRTPRLVIMGENRISMAGSFEFFHVMLRGGEGNIGRPISPFNISLANFLQGLAQIAHRFVGGAAFTQEVEFRMRPARRRKEICLALMRRKRPGEVDEALPARLRRARA